MAKILCPYCQQSVAVRTSNQVTDTTREIYTNCNNNACLARPVFIISHSHDTQAPLSHIMSPTEYAASILENLNPKERHNLLSKFELKK